MTSEELADEVRLLVDSCQARVLGVGDEQYSIGETQKFESLEVDQLFEWAEEEIQDIVNYAVMLNIRLRRLRASMQVVIAAFDG